MQPTVIWARQLRKDYDLDEAFRFICKCFCRRVGFPLLSLVTAQSQHGISDLQGLLHFLCPAFLSFAGHRLNGCNWHELDCSALRGRVYD